jgi:hypothetical protein
MLLRRLKTPPRRRSVSIGGAVSVTASLLLLLVDHVHDGHPRRRPFLWPGLFEADVYYMLDRVVNVRHERYQSEACAAAHMVTAAQASTKFYARSRRAEAAGYGRTNE